MTDEIPQVHRLEDVLIDDAIANAPPWDHHDHVIDADKCQAFYEAALKRWPEDRERIKELKGSLSEWQDDFKSTLERAERAEALLRTIREVSDTATTEGYPRDALMRLQAVISNVDKLLEGRGDE